MRIVPGLLAGLLAATSVVVVGEPAEADVAGLGVIEVASTEANPEAVEGRSVAVLVTDPDGDVGIKHYVAPTAAAADEYVDRIETHREVLAASVDAPVRATATNDTLRYTQWDLDQMNIDAAYVESTGSGIKVAVLDTGIDASHTDLAGQVLNGTDFVNDSFTTSSSGTGKVDPHGHGTHVSGTIAAKTNNNLGISAVAPNASIIPVRVLDEYGRGWDSNIAAGVIWATDNGAQVINLSLGGPTGTNVMHEAVQYAVAQGVVVVAAAGNDGDSGNPLLYPASFSETISVAATDSTGTAQSWSEHNAEVDIAAPGALISSTATGGGYVYMSGTSMAAPHVAGVAALLKAAEPTATVSDIRAWMQTTATECGAVGRDDHCGYGHVNPVGALAAANAAGTTTTTSTTTTAAPTTTTTTAPPPPTTQLPAPIYRPTTGYRTLSSEGVVSAFGSSQWYGNAEGRISGEAVTLAATNTNNGYWVASSNGDVVPFGDAGSFGSMTGKALNAPIINMAVTPSGKGYWLLAKDGGVFTFGDAGFYGSTGNLKLNQPAVGMTPSASGRGYWFVASDGGIFAFGDAPFLGSMGGNKLNRPVTGMTVSTTGNGYRMVAADGGIFSFGDVAFYGSLGANPPSAPIQAMQPTRSNGGYYMVTVDGAVYTFGDAGFYGTPRTRSKTVAVSY